MPAAPGPGQIRQVRPLAAGAGLGTWHGITTACADVRTATVAACFLEESAELQLRMLTAAGGDAARIRAFTREEAERVSDQLTAPIVERAWEYYAAIASV